MKLNDREMLADLVAAAVNMAMSKAREEVAKASQAMAQDAGLPPGMLAGQWMPGSSEGRVDESTQDVLHTRHG